MLPLGLGLGAGARCFVLSPFFCFPATLRSDHRGVSLDLEVLVLVASTASPGQPPLEAPVQRAVGVVGLCEQQKFIPNCPRVVAVPPRPRPSLLLLLLLPNHLGSLMIVVEPALRAATDRSLRRRRSSYSDGAPSILAVRHFQEVGLLPLLPGHPAAATTERPRSGAGTALPTNDLLCVMHMVPGLEQRLRLVARRGRRRRCDGGSGGGGGRGLAPTAAAAEGHRKRGLAHVPLRRFGVGVVLDARDPGLEVRHGVRHARCAAAAAGPLLVVVVVVVAVAL